MAPYVISAASAAALLGIAIAELRHVSHSGAAQLTNPARSAVALLMVPDQLKLLLQDDERTT